MTKARIRKIDARGFNERAMRVYEESDMGALEMMLEALPDHVSDDDVADELESFYNDIFNDDEEDLADGDLEDQLQNLLADGDAKDKDLEQGYPETVFEESRRYVVLVKARGVYLPELELESNELFVAACDFEDAYNQLDDILADRGGVGTVTLFDRDEDRDLKHVELVRYAKEVQ